MRHPVYEFTSIVTYLTAIHFCLHLLYSCKFEAKFYVTEL